MKRVGKKGYRIFQKAVKKINFRVVQILALLFFTNCSNVVSSQYNLQNRVDEVLQKSEYRNAAAGFHILDVNSGEPIFQQQSDKLFIPASTLKLVTTAAALELLGPDYQFKTTIAYRGKLVEKVLQGDLVLVGGGDPALGSEHFPENDFLEKWVNQIKNAGIEKIEGNLVLDASIYDSEEAPETWMWGDIANYYGVSPNAFTVFDNLFRISFASPENEGEPTRIISTYPEMENLQFKNEVLSSDEESDQAYVFGSPFSDERLIRGTIPKNRKSFTIKAAMPNPQKILANEFLHRMAKNGVFISGKIMFDTADKKELKTIFIDESPVLSEIIQRINHKSINLFAEHLVKQIAFEKDGMGSRKQGIKIIQDFWEKRGLEPFFMDDGSGLSHFNAVSPENLTSVLVFMKNKSANSKQFINSLATAGTGTLSVFDEKTFPGNTLQAKSGSMTRVLGYAGYLQTNTGKTLAFSFIFNHFQGSHSGLRKEVEKLLIDIKENY